MRILVAGDTHGNLAWCTKLCSIAREQGCTTVLQVGDFGYWPHVQWGQKFLVALEKRAKQSGVTIYWIDGNHENHDVLRDLPRAGDGFVDISERIRHIPRGHRWTWEGVRFGALGGAFSIDWRQRTLGYSWWPGELVQPEDVEALGSDPLDVLVTHDVPAGVTMVSSFVLPPLDEEMGRRVRTLVRKAVDVTRPQLVLHGHWHQRASNLLDGVRVEGLAADVQGDRSAWGVLELPSLAFS